MKRYDYKFGKKYDLSLGKNKKSQFKTFNFSKGFKPFTFFKDSDRDGVLNLFDCKPYDPKQQHVRPSQATRERLKKLPIYFTTNPRGEKLKFLYSLQGTVVRYDPEKGYKQEVKAKSIPPEIKQAITRFYSMIKKRPDVLGEIERKKPYVVVFSTRGGSIEKGYAHYFPANGRFQRTKTKGKHEVVVRPASTVGRRYGREETEETASTAIHELEHLRQFEAYGSKPKLAKKMTKGRYAKRRIEVLAREAEAKAQKKRYKYPSEEAFREGIEKTQERFDILEEE